MYRVRKCRQDEASAKGQPCNRDTLLVFVDLARCRVFDMEADNVQGGVQGVRIGSAHPERLANSADATYLTPKNEVHLL